MAYLKLAFALLLLLPLAASAETPQENLDQCLCDCSCREIGWECYTSNEICKYDVPADPRLQNGCPEESAGACLCRSSYGCTRLPQASRGDCYATCMPQQTPEPTATPIEATPTPAGEEICGNGQDDDGDRFVDCFDTTDCHCSQTAWLTVTYDDGDGRQKPLEGANVTFLWIGAGYSQNDASALTDEDGKAYARLDGLWEGDGGVEFEVGLSDPKFRMMEGGSLYAATGDFTVEDEGNLNRRYELEGNDRIAARIWLRTHEAYDFYTRILHTNVDNQMPEDLELKPGENGGAAHSSDSATGAVDMGIMFRSKVFAKGFTSKDSPQNCEWHEFSHHAMMAIYGGMWDSKAIKNHLGWGNPQSDDSYVEGFPEFMSLLMTASYADNYPRLAAHPSVYYYGGSAANLEKNFNIKDDEEFAVASILWDLYDPQSDSLVDKDHVQIDRTTLWTVMSTPHTFSDRETRYIHSTRDLYEAVSAVNDPQFNRKHTDYFEPRDDAWMDEATALDKIFIAHGAFWDKNGNGIRDGEEETVGYTPKKNDPATRRTDKELPPGSFIRANINDGAVTDGFVHVKVTHDGEYSYLDYEYESDFQDGFIGIDPPYDVPTTWEISVSGDGQGESAPVTLTSDQYNDNYDPNDGYFGTADFTLGAAGEEPTPDYWGGDETPTPYPYGGYTPSGEPPGEECCIPMFVLLGLGGAGLLVSRQKLDQRSS